MSREVQVRFCESRAVRSRPATHLVVMCHTRGQAEQAWRRLAEWLRPRGLAINEDKTRIVDFLGFNVRRYGDKLLIKPSPMAMQRIITLRCGGAGVRRRGRGLRRALRPRARARTAGRGAGRAVRPQARLQQDG
jgi:hypothetical protein